MGEIDQYFKALLKMDPKVSTPQFKSLIQQISSCDYVLRFFIMNSMDFKYVDVQRAVQAHADPVTGAFLSIHSLHSIFTHVKMAPSFASAAPH